MTKCELLYALIQDRIINILELISDIDSDTSDSLTNSQERFMAGMGSKCRKMLESGLEFWYYEQYK